MSTNTSTSQSSEPPWARDIPGKDLPWYVPNIEKQLTPVVTEMLEKYAKVPHNEMSSHLHTMRDKAYAIASYPTTGSGAFIIPYIYKSPAYDEVLNTLKSGGTFLDVGCILGVDMRKIVFDGAPSENMTGVDIRIEFWDVGYELYRDRETFKARGIQGDVLSLSENPALKDLRRNKLDVMSISAVLHQFDWEKQVIAAKQMIAFSKAGTLIVGHQIGRKEGGPSVFGPTNTPIFVQGPQSFAKLWKEAGEGTGTEWEVQAEHLPWTVLGLDAKDLPFMNTFDGPLGFVVRRVS